ncbi:MAG: hypothetical protein AAFR87_04090 [Bacteroidota bacterium]
MKEKHPIDSFFKEKLANQQYPMKEEYWSAAADLIEAHGGRKRKRFLWLFLLIGLLITGSTIGYNFSTNSEEELLALRELTSTTEYKTDEYVPTLAGVELEKGGIAVKEVESKPFLSTENSPESRLKMLGNASPLANADIQAEREVEEKRSADQEKINPEYANRVLDALGLEKPALEDQKVDRGVGQRTKEKEQVIDYKARVLDERAFELEEQKQSNPSFHYPGRASRRKHQFGLDVGYAVNKGIKDPTSSGQSLGMSPVIGISYRQRFNANLEFISGLRYTQMPSLAGDSTFTSTDFSFGAQVEGINIKALSLHQAEIPVQLAWYVSPRSKIIGGVYFRYLINVQSEVSQFESNPFESTPGPINRAWGYKQGFSDLDYGLQLGYFYHLSEGLQIGLETQFGLKDIRDNAFYRINSFDRNLNARIILRYHFLN